MKNLSSLENRTASEILNLFDDVIFELDTDNNFTFVNSKAEQFWNRTSEELLGKNIWQEISVTYKTNLQKSIETALLKKTANDNTFISPKNNQLFSVKAIPSDSGTVVFLKDISLTKEIELEENILYLQAEFKKSQELLKSLFDSSFHMISVLKAVRSEQGEITDFEYTMANDVLRIHQKDIELVGKKYSQLCPRMVEAGIFQQFKAVIETGKATTFEIHYNYDGINRWFKINVSKNQDGLVAISEDITERINSEQKIQANSIFLQSVIDHSLTGIAVFKAIRNEKNAIIDFEWLLVNKKNNEISRRAELLGKRYAELYPGIKETDVFKNYVKTVEKNIPADFEIHYTNEGYDNWFHIRSIKFDDGLLVCTEDITNRKRAEIELEESKKLLHKIINAPNIGLAVYKAIRNKKGNITDFTHEFVNKRTIEFLGKDVTGWRLTDHGKDGVQQLPFFIQVMKTGNIDSYVRNTQFNGEEFWFMFNNAKLDNERLIHVWEDITEIKKAEREIKENKEKLEAAFNVSTTSLLILKAFRNEQKEITDFTYDWLNEAAHQNIGYYNAEKSLMDAFPYIKEIGLFAKLAEAIETNQPLEFISQYPTLKHHLWIRWKAVKLNDGLFVSIEDITKNREKEEALIQLNTALSLQNTLLEHGEQMAKTGSWTWNLDTNKIQYSDNCYLIYGISPHSIPPGWESFGPYIHPEDISKVNDIIEKMKLTSQPSNIEYRIFSYTGELKFINANNKIITSPKGEKIIIGTIQDITELKQAERKLKENNELLESVFETAVMGLLVAEKIRNTKGEIIDYKFNLLNETGKKLLGIDLTGKLRSEVFPFGQELCHINALIEKEETVDYEKHFKGPHLKGWFRITAVKLADGIVVGFDDITKHKHQVLELKETHEKLKAIFEKGQMQLGYYKAIRDENGFIIDYYIDSANPSSDKQLNSPITLTGNRLTHILDGLHQHPIWQRMVQATETGEAQRFEEYMDFPIIKGWYDFSYIKSGDGIISQSLNITERKLGEQQLIDTNHFIKQITNTTPDIIYVLDIVNKKMIYINERASEIVGYTMQELMSLPVSPFQYLSIPEDLEKRTIHISQLHSLNENETKTIEMRIKTLKGHYRWFKIRDRIFKKDEAGNVIQILGVAQDITEQVNAEEELIKLKLNQQKEILNAVLAIQEEERKSIAESLHNGLGQMLYAIRMKLNTISSKQTRDDQLRLKEVDKQLEQAVDTTRNISLLLTPHLLEAFGLKEAIQSMINKLITDCLWVSLKYNSTSSLDPSMEIAVFRIVQELLNNIVKHSNASIANIQIEIDAVKLTIEVKDNGRGMERKSGEASGGIGLKMIENRLKLLNGHMYIESTREKGTKIKISIER